MSTAATVRIGTRASTLARTQTGLVADALGVPVEVVPVQTAGDRSAAELTQIGGTGVFVSALRSALLAADLVLIPVQPSPFDGWASAEMLALIREARIYRREMLVRFVLNRCGARTVLARETARTLADHDPPVLASTIGQRIAFAAAAQSGRLVFERDDAGPATREIAALSAEINGLDLGRPAR